MPLTYFAWGCFQLFRESFTSGLRYPLSCRVDSSLILANEPRWCEPRCAALVVVRQGLRTGRHRLSHRRERRRSGRPTTQAPAAEEVGTSSVCRAIGATRRQVRVEFLAGWRHRVIIFCSLALLALLVAASLIPAKWQYLRTGLGWQSDHFIGFFVATSVVCSAWPRPLLVGPILMATAALLEGLQALTPDRVPNFEAALYGAGGTLVAALLATLFIRVRKRGAG